MSMVVQHNLTAMNSNRMLGITTSAQAKATEKLSSGYKINRAADDAAGLAISEKMRKQIRGLTQASANAQDGISAVQTAEGALTEVHDMLQRMNELAVKAANSPESETDRQAIQSEIDQLVTEIDRVATTTKFNETYLLKGRNADGTAAKLTYSTANASGRITKAGIKFDTDGVYSIAVTTKGVATAVATEVKDEIKNYEKSTTITAKSVTLGDKTYYLVESSSDLTTTMAAASVSQIVDKFNEKQDNFDEKQAFTSMDDMLAQIKKDLGSDVKSVVIDAETNKDTTKSVLVRIDAFADLNNAMNVSLHVGADSSADNKIDMSISMMSARGLGINGLYLGGDTDDRATAAIDTIADAIAKVSSQRDSLGAIQNRLEHTISNLDNIVENTTSAESAIRDTDMATQMVEYSKNQILSQAGQSMLAQANSANQGVLSLLQ